MISALLFPAPSTILATIGRLSASGVLFEHTLASLNRLAMGVLIGGTSGTLLGLLMGWSRPLRILLDPFIAAAHPIPKIAILPLILIFFGLGDTSKIVVTSLAAFFPMLINSLAGVRQIHPIYFEVAKNYGASPLRTFLRVILPASLPFVLTGVLLAVNITLLLTIAIEMVTATNGLGWLIWQAWQTMRIEEVYASLVVIAVIGLVTNTLMHRIIAWLVPWQTEQPNHPNG
jgi:NitT/TauT family transport system permease protein